ncbi:MAG TPA: inosine monophosphate cyclohydrolase [Firmicutes bacterium]|jgi:hypothetical protein|nr:inosine monophosphate cyclohydrolase [Bacillota bacterium]HBT18274.1 inosine monophosphate cyclohydrolase [Bacillota bacterium]
MSFNSIALFNMKKLEENVYPGRGIIQGLTPDAQYMVQIYWLMGRSENSRNRLFVQEDGFVKTKAFDERKVTDPSLIIYYPVKFFENSHIVSNGDQTDTIYQHLKANGSFENALNTRAFEPDSPNYTPRISGIINLDNQENAYQLSILKTTNNNPQYPLRIFFNYPQAIPGYGHCLHTYEDNGDPLPSFKGEPYLVKLFSKIEENANFYWELLNQDHKVALLVKMIRTDSGEYQVVIINKHELK